MEYVFGTETRRGVMVEVLKVVSADPIRMSVGNYSIKREYTDSVITDNFTLVSKIRDKVSDGFYYAWYEIRDHYRYEDKFTPGIKATEQEITDQDLAIMEAEQAITDLDIRVIELELE